MDELRVKEMVKGGASLRRIAEDLRVDPSTARKWVARLGLETKHQRTKREAAEARERGAGELIRACPSHGITLFRIDSRGSYRCGRCNSERVMARRRAIKRILTDELGGRCLLCGYDACDRALEFHHVDPAEKSFAIGFEGVTRSLARAHAEAAKCVLLCSNCHAEVEAGVASLP